MEVGKTESGFTVVEVVVSLIVMSVFLTLLFQLYMATQSQQLAAKQLASANDIAQSNLRKITARSLVPSTRACSTALDLTQTANPTDADSLLTLTDSSTIRRENLSDTSLPSTTVQELRIVYPQGCYAAMPARITSTVRYGSETVVRATYVN